MILRLSRLLRRLKKLRFRSLLKLRPKSLFSLCRRWKRFRERTSRFRKSRKLSSAGTIRPMKSLLLARKSSPRKNLRLLVFQERRKYSTLQASEDRSASGLKTFTAYTRTRRLSSSSKALSPFAPVPALTSSISTTWRTRSKACDSKSLRAWISRSCRSCSKTCGRLKCFARRSDRSLAGRLTSEHRPWFKNSA